MVVGCAIATLLFENLSTNKLIYRRKLDGLAAENWKKDHRLLNACQGLAMGLVGSLQCVLSFSMIRKRGAHSLAFTGLGGALIAHCTSALSATDSWFTFLAAAATYSFLYEPAPSPYASSEPRRKMKLTQVISLLALCSFVGLTVVLLRGPERLSSLHPIGSTSHAPAPHEDHGPLHPPTSSTHPIYQLINNAEQAFEAVKAGQSKSLAEAVAEYRRRYGIPPPPNFDKWYEFAKNRGIQLVDEYDTIHHSLLPFWALEPSTIRARARESLGYPNALLALLIRDGAPVKIEGGGDWQQQATLGMIKDFVHYLPDMDIAFNIHDEPRVVVPHDDLARMVAVAKEITMPAALANERPRNLFSSRPADMNDGKRIVEVKTTRFNKFAHQPTWTNSRVSCSPDSPARSLDEHAPDNITSYALGELGFLYNDTAFSDICMSPSLKETYGFFDRPNAFDIVHDLFPIFSQSKISSFQDIVYPSPWYWYGKVTYQEDKDVEWQQKESKMYWRGSTTGGFSRDGGWRRQHRQRLVRRINAPDTAKILENFGDGATSNWHVKEVKRQDYQDIFDVKFSHVGQCDPGDCDAQREFFTVVKPAGQQDAWASRFLLDIDGNAFSGRFYAFLRSKSLVYKLAVFREWHQDWLKPWVHYIPLGLQGDEWLESVRYFAGEDEGKAHAQRLADQGRQWAGRALRNEDFEVWSFRLLLEYGRLVDDNRESIGFSGQ
ncbi:MAG: capsule-associated protein CAP1 [Candelina mexicana]|nr:MAG: capsule-associated protein CAP1 [Candelina mexicana]